MNVSAPLITLLATSGLAVGSQASDPPDRDRGITSRAPIVNVPQVLPDETAIPAEVSRRVPRELIEKMQTDLSLHLGDTAGSAKLIRAESVTWPDGALGCREPGERYTQQPVPGYRVEFAVGEETYAYHAVARSGYFKLCRRTPRASGS